MRLAALVTLVLFLAGGAAGGEPSTDVSDVLQRIDRMTAQIPPGSWTDADYEALRAGLRADPRAVISHLVERLEVDEGAATHPASSVFHTVSGNTLTLLDRLTSENVGGVTKPYIGFATRDHRGRSPNKEIVYGPWRGWLEVRKDIPVEKWFWGMSYAELATVMPLLRMGDGQWEEGALERVRALGKRVYPYLLDKLLDEGYAGDDFRVCDRANDLLRRLTGTDLGELVRHQLLCLQPETELRKWRYAITENQASMALMQRRWMERLLVQE